MTFSSSLLIVVRPHLALTSFWRATLRSCFHTEHLTLLPSFFTFCPSKLSSINLTDDFTESTVFHWLFKTGFYFGFFWGGAIFFFFVFLLALGDRVSRCSSCWPGNIYVDQADFQLRDPSALASWVPGSKCTSTPSLGLLFFSPFLSLPPWPSSSFCSVRFVSRFTLNSWGLFCCSWGQCALTVDRF